MLQELPSPNSEYVTEMSAPQDLPIYLIRQTFVKYALRLLCRIQRSKVNVVFLPSVMSRRNFVPQER